MKKPEDRSSMKMIIIEVSTGMTNKELIAWIESKFGKGEGVRLTQKPRVQQVKELK